MTYTSDLSKGNNYNFDNNSKCVISSSLFILSLGEHMIHSKEIVNAIGAHGNWKQRLRRAIETGRSDITFDKIRYDNHCDFGKWLHSLSSYEKKSFHWIKIQQLHAKFHTEAARLIELALYGRQKEALDAMGLGTDFARYSSELTMAMVQWKSSLKQTVNPTKYLDVPILSYDFANDV